MIKRAFTAAGRSLTHYLDTYTGAHDPFWILSSWMVLITIILASLNH